MCSSPKGSEKKRRQVKKSEYSRSDREEYATMVERASAVYDRIEQEKADRRLAMSLQQSSISDRQEDVSDSIDKSHSNALSRIKAFLSKSIL